MSELSKQRKLQHLFLRAGFGAGINEIQKHLNSSPEKTAEILLNNSLHYAELELKFNQKLQEKDSLPLNPKELSKKEKKQFQKQSRENLKELNISWINKMCNDKSVLRERMTLFWHGHFACKSRVALFMKNQNNTLRKHALGNFADLLKSISKDPAMLQFLNNQQNRKSSPNENFARELLELFTLGRGNYSEKDIKEAARAFTGWGFDKNGEFKDRKKLHDEDEKKFMGVSGNLDGNNILDIILDNRKTAEHITKKLYAYFVNENINKEITNYLSKEYYESGYDTGKLMKRIFTSDWFYNKENIGVKIKSPVDLICGLKKSFGLDFENPESLLVIQKNLGQTLLHPPNVAGWPGGRSWIDSSSLMFRMKLPEYIFLSAGRGFDYEINSGKNSKRKEKFPVKNFKVKSDMSGFLSAFGKFSGDELTDKLCEYLLQSDAGNETKKLVKKYSDYSGKENSIESMTMRILSLPEYQLC